MECGGLAAAFAVPTHSPSALWGHSPTTASASTSTNISGDIKLLTCTMLVAGRIDPKNSPCARPTFSH